MDKKNLTEKEIEEIALKNSLKKFYESKNIEFNQGQSSQSIEGKIPKQIDIPNSEYSSENIQKQMSIETDPDLLMSYEIVSLPSKGLFYKDGLKEISIEYLTSKDEDLLTTPSFIEDGSVINRLLERKIITKNVNPNNLLSGDRSALILFLRTSSYGQYYNVSVPDPRTGVSFDAEVDLLKLKYKKIEKKPDENLEFSVDIPMRKKTVKFKLLTSGEEEIILKNADARQEAYGLDHSEFNTMRLKASIKEINGNRDRLYIDKFVDVMPSGDAFTIRKEILTVSPDVDMKYKFKASDGFEFIAPLSMGMDFFFPSL